jgi:hypothetical protein
MADEKRGIIVKSAEEVTYVGGQIADSLGRLSEHGVNNLGNELGISDVVHGHVQGHPPYNELWKVTNEGGVTHYYLVEVEYADEKLHIGGGRSIVEDVKILLRGLRSDSR